MKELPKYQGVCKKCSGTGTYHFMDEFGDECSEDCLDCDKTGHVNITISHEMYERHGCCNRDELKEKYKEYKDEFKRVRREMVSIENYLKRK